MRRLIALVILLMMLMPMNVFAAEIPVLESKIDDFDAVYYAVQNPDVVAVFGTDADELYKHYLEYGKKEGRLPNALATPLVTRDYFDPVYYAVQNPDVVASFGTDPASLYFHYLNAGKAEGRKPNDGTLKSVEEKKPEVAEEVVPEKEADETEVLEEESVSKEEAAKDGVIGEFAGKKFILDMTLPHKIVSSVDGQTLAGTIDITDIEVRKAYNDYMYLVLKAAKVVTHRGVVAYYPTILITDSNEKTMQTIRVTVMPFEGTYYGLIEPLEEGEYTVKYK